MKKLSLPFILIIVAIILLASTLPIRASLPDWRDKIDPWVLSQSESGLAEFLVYMEQQADLSQASKIQMKAQKGLYVYEQLQKMAEKTQGPILALLQSSGIPHRSYWIANMIWVQGNQETLH